jgi:hypothetical protein
MTRTGGNKLDKPIREYSAFIDLEALAASGKSFDATHLAKAQARAAGRHPAKMRESVVLG